MPSEFLICGRSSPPWTRVPSVPLGVVIIQTCGTVTMSVIPNTAASRTGLRCLRYGHSCCFPVNYQGRPNVAPTFRPTKLDRCRSHCSTVRREPTHRPLTHRSNRRALPRPSFTPLASISASMSSICAFLSHQRDFHQDCGVRSICVPSGAGASSVISSSRLTASSRQLLRVAFDAARFV